MDPIVDIAIKMSTQMLKEFIDTKAEKTKDYIYEKVLKKNKEDSIRKVIVFVWLVRENPILLIIY